MKLCILLAILTLHLFGGNTMARPVPPYLADVVGKTPDKATLRALKGEERSTFLQSWVMLQVHNTGKEGYSDAEQIVLPLLSTPMRNHYFVFWIGYRVGDSGLSGYWDFSTPPAFTEEAIAAFRSLGLPKHARQLEKANELFQKHLADYRKAVGPDKQNAVYDAFDEDVQQIESDLGDLDWFLLKERLKYIEKHIGEFQNPAPIGIGSPLAGIGVKLRTARKFFMSFISCAL